MKRRRKRWIKGVALFGGAFASAALVLWRSGRSKMQGGESSNRKKRDANADRWARPGMAVTFRGELMPGRSRAERTFRIVKLLPSGRVALENFAGEHAEQEFEPIR